MIKCQNGKTELAGKTLDLALEANCILMSLHKVSPELLAGIITGWTDFVTEEYESRKLNIMKAEAVVQTTEMFVKEVKNENE